MEIKINNVYNMDCMAGMKYMPDDSVDFTLTDIPYNFWNCLRTSKERAVYKRQQRTINKGIADILTQVWCVL